MRDRGAGSRGYGDDELLKVLGAKADGLEMPEPTPLSLKLLSCLGGSVHELVEQLPELEVDERDRDGLALTAEHSGADVDDGRPLPVPGVRP